MICCDSAENIASTFGSTSLEQIAKPFDDEAGYTLAEHRPLLLQPLKGLFQSRFRDGDR